MFLLAVALRRLDNRDGLLLFVFAVQSRTVLTLKLYIKFSTSVHLQTHRTKTLPTVYSIGEEGVIGCWFADICLASAPRTFNSR